MSGRQDRRPLWMQLGEKSPCLCGGVKVHPKALEIWKLYAESHTIKQIGPLVGLSVKTVEHHIARLQKQLNTFGGARLTMSAIRNEIIEP